MATSMATAATTTDDRMLMDKSASFDVAIVGAGVIGLSVALHLLDAGRSVVVLEKAEIGSGASHGNCGTITPSHALPLAQPGMIGKALQQMFLKDAPFYVRPRFDPALFSFMLQFARRCSASQVRRAAKHRAALLNLSRQLLEELIHARAIDCEFSASGLLTVFRDEKAFAEARHLERDLADIGIPIEAWTPAQVLAREPALKPGVVAGHWYPTDANLRPDRLVAALASRVREAGGVIREQSAVAGFIAPGAQAIAPVCADGPVNARQTVICGGAWSPLIAKKLKLHLSIQPGKGYSITYSRPQVCPSLPLVLRERSVCVTSWASGFRLGSTMEFSGYDNSLNRLRLDALVRAAREYLIEPEGAERVEEWAGWRPMMPDDLPLIGPSSRVQGLWFATGHGMLGVSMAVATGRLLTDQMLQRPPLIEMAAFAPRRLGV